ncbi:hypothetical protein [Serratia plymuthica]|uniref:hypothetical protein n=1 Tax=Serratia plymuthica TaxID=82996 RepID=UPI0011BDEFEE|nr:hypothetical protein [Serratia plymuthica]
MKYKAEITFYEHGKEPLIIQFNESFQTEIDAFDHGKKQIKRYSDNRQCDWKSVDCQVIAVPESEE